MAWLPTVLPVAQIILSVLLIGGILLQQRGAGLGGAFGESATTSYYTRRGAEKVLFQATIVVAVLFALSAALQLFLK